MIEGWPEKIQAAQKSCQKHSVGSPFLRFDTEMSRMTGVRTEFLATTAEFERASLMSPVGRLEKSPAGSGRLISWDCLFEEREQQAF